MLRLHEALQGVPDFIAAGGPVLYAVAGLTFVMWTLVFERAWYFRFGLPADVGAMLAAWDARPERRSWHAHQVRRAMLSRLGLRIGRNLALIRTCVSLCPLLGVLGTVTGMVVVFHVLAVGGGDVRSMAEGVSRATIPTMAGMVAAISGLLANIYVTRVARRELLLAEDRLTTDH
ncbi:MAG: MotA/TolQ/ExbB proton channel family protein [Pseudomonadales bacterium]|nr:MotA/TolQ/ExbB proton channel family protein [Pseudomonadales bacterium]MBP9032742.1 MotA/TolQ/ExbB proton channel family protein [Pseudomonadales bacterium]